MNLPGIGGAFPDMDFELPSFVLYFAAPLVGVVGRFLGYRDYLFEC